MEPLTIESLIVLPIGRACAVQIVLRGCGYGYMRATCGRVWSSGGGSGKMGLGPKLSGATFFGGVAQNNPDPSNWEALKAERCEGFLIVELRYPDCTNYEGKKILVFEEFTIEDLFHQRKVDPHFFQSSKKYKSPIARFEPTERGWEMAKAFTRAYSSKAF